MSTREQLMAMKVGETKDVVFCNGILRSTKELYKNSDNQFELHSFTSGWHTAILTLDKAVDFCEDRLQTWEIEWE